MGLVAVFVAVILVPALASAGPGDGVKAGDVTLVPKLTLSGGYDSNVFRLAEEEEPSVAERSAALGKITPSLSITSPEDNFLYFDFGSAVTWEQYFDSNEGTRNQSGLSTDLSLTGALNRSGNFSLTIDDRFERTNEPPTTAGGSSFNRLSNTLGVAFGIHPGSRIVDAELGYEWSRYWHETDLLQSLDRSRHSFNFNLAYNFLPKTGVFLDAQYDLIRYDSPNRTAGEDGLTISNVNSQPLRITGGFKGLITQRLSIRAAAGYGSSFYESGDQFRGPIGSAAIGYAYGPMHLNNMMQLGYRYSFDDASLGNFFSNHRLFLKVNQTIVEDRFDFNTEVGLNARSYSFDPSGIPEIGFDGELNDLLLTVGAGLNYNITKWWSAGVDYDLRTNLTDDELLLGSPTDPSQPSTASFRNYVQHQVFLTTTLRY
jgi:hypothetical protein